MLNYLSKIIDWIETGVLFGFQKTAISSRLDLLLPFVHTQLVIVRKIVDILNSESQYIKNKRWFLYIYRNSALLLMSLSLYW